MEHHSGSVVATARLTQSLLATVAAKVVQLIRTDPALGLVVGHLEELLLQVSCQPPLDLPIGRSEQGLDDDFLLDGQLFYRSRWDIEDPRGLMQGLA